MTRSELLATIKKAERESDRACRSLGVLWRMVELVLAINGEAEVVPADPRMADTVQTLTKAPRPVLQEWAAVCCHDPLLHYLITSRKKYAQIDQKRGKGARELEVSVNLTYQGAMQAGFRGSRNQWEVLLRMRA